MNPSAQPPLDEGEIELVEDEELWRQIHPSWIDNDGVCKTAFLPAAKDEGKLSSTQSTKITAEDAYLEYVDNLELTSAGVLSIRVTEASAADLRVIDDYSSNTRPTPCPTGHCYNIAR
jgi:hypothetical protein